VLDKIDLSRIKIRLESINKKAAKSVSFDPADIPSRMQEFYLSPTMKCLEDMSLAYKLTPNDCTLMGDWGMYGYDESTQDYRALEGDLVFCSSSIVKIEEKYTFNLTVLPYFLTSMAKFKGKHNDEIRFAENSNKERNKILIRSKIKLILDSVEPHSVVFIDGPLVGGMASSYMVKMDQELRERDCIPLYFVKNSDSKLVVGSIRGLAGEFNSDFHWASMRLSERNRSAFFKYTDLHSNRNSKVFTYVKALLGFTERVEMHSLTYEKYHGLIPSLMNLIAYFYITQGDFSNPQVRPIAIAEKYAREGLRILNIPVLLSRLGFTPTINQIRFGG
jgi:hypothetical protein